MEQCCSPSPLKRWRAQVLYRFPEAERSNQEGCFPVALDSQCHRCPQWKQVLYYTTVNLLSGFWQTPMEESSKQYTAFTVGMLGFFQCECMPFGLCNAPATFQQLMINCLGELNYSACLIYLDNVVIYSTTQEEHIECLRAVLKCFHLHGLKLKPSKCKFFWEKIEYLGHSVSLKGVWPSRDNLKVIAKYPEPMTCTTIKGFVGMVGHY